MKTDSIGFIGGGRITQIFLSALFDNENFNKDIVVSDPDPMCRETIEENFTSVLTTA